MDTLKAARPPQEAEAALDAAIPQAVERVAPTWPLDRLIAVNPYWGWVRNAMPEAAAALGVLAGTRLTMPREWFLQQWQAGCLQRRHLHAAAALALREEGDVDADAARVHERVTELEAALHGRAAVLPRLPLVTDLRGGDAGPQPGLCWSDFVTHQIGQHCAAFFDRHQALWSMQRSDGLYGSWRHQLAAHPPRLQGICGERLQARLRALPSDPRSAIAHMLSEMAFSPEALAPYLSAALMAVGGWAAWCAYERWEARLGGRDDDGIVHLLAVRVAWEWLLSDDAPAGPMTAAWAAQWAGYGQSVHALRKAQQLDWQLQNAVEIAYQQPLIAALSQPPTARGPERSAVQAVFCIDVRSERYRRHLEAVAPSVRTLGFAGFFGLPIAYSPFGTDLVRPQLPGLLAAQYRVLERPEGVGLGLGQALAAQRRESLALRQRWQAFRATSLSAFGFVETLGLAYGPKLLLDSLPFGASPPRWEHAGVAPELAQTLRPFVPETADDPAAAAALAKTVLVAMGLVERFAPLVLLVGHGSASANNPHAAGLDCGACGGQSGEVNVRVLAGMLNAVQVREHLRRLGIDIPETTRFLPAMHNTATDDVTLHDAQALPSALQYPLIQLRDWLTAASALTRAERSAGLGIPAGPGRDAALKKALRERANDWAEVRPEWGLADNAALVVAPRARSQRADLAGRVFLHDYDFRQDPQLERLRLIMTAPMVVAHWINMQYHASTVDNRRYGSGNKLLHNVVGGKLGVFEGNGGDLRIGLPIQSLHDGQVLRHTPLRLSVFVEAPREAIEQVMAAQEIVHSLVANGWLHLFRIDPETDAIERRHRGRWFPASEASVAE